MSFKRHQNICIKRYSIVVVLLCNTLAMVHAQNTQLEWVKTFGNSSSSQMEVPEAIDIDASGNIYTIGEFFNTVDFDPGSGVLNLTSVGDSDNYIQKLDASGNLLWAKSFGNGVSDPIVDFKIDQNGDLILYGVFRHVLDLDPGTGVNIVGDASQNTSVHSYLIKLDANGNYIWGKALLASNVNSRLFAGAITLDNANNIYVAGSFKGTIDFDPSTGLQEETSHYTGSSYVKNSFLVKLDAAGNFNWVKTIIDDNTNSIVKITNHNNDLILLGIFKGVIDVDFSGATYNITEQWSGNDAFIMKTDLDGSFSWAKIFGGDLSFITPNHLSIDSLGNILIGGEFNGVNLDVDPGPGEYILPYNASDDSFVIKWNQLGDFVWATSFGGTSFDRIKAISLDDENNLYSVGYFYDTVDFDGGTGTDMFTANSFGNMFVNKLNANGSYAWTSVISGTDTTFGLSIKIDSNKNLFITGGFDGTADFDATAGVTNITTNGGRDAFVLKLSQPALSISDSNFPTPLGLYPNPSNGIMTLDLQQVYGDIVITLKDSTGKKLSTQQIYNQQQIPLNYLQTSGMYFLEVTAGTKTANLKLIIQ